MNMIFITKKFPKTKSYAECILSDCLLMNKAVTVDHYKKEHNNLYSNNHGDYIILSICPYCGKRFCGRGRVDDHIRKDHIDET